MFRKAEARHARGFTPAAAALKGAIKAPRDMNRMATPCLPKSAPTSFVRQRWVRQCCGLAASSTGVITNIPMKQMTHQAA